ncbi:MAG: TIGR03792 family protein [Actinobacteria bacterium]|nr:TIGR03792 family protein [Actinomycetota bacterium]
MSHEESSTPQSYRYLKDERLPVEVLVFEVAPEDLEDFLALDHEIWTLKEAFGQGLPHVPFISKEVWLNDSRPGQATLVFVWESMEAWDTVGQTEFQEALQAEFDARFGRPVRLVRAYHELAEMGIHRYSRFERDEEPTVG